MIEHYRKFKDTTQ